ncbi:MAG: hypothetical protein J6R59_00920 [Paludibacteraceae bacterium]|nr:hypothetical protein [Paludibacteraceae bacterium]
MTVIFILGCIGYMYEEDVAGDYERAMNKAIKDMEKGITTVITDGPNGAFSVEKTKDGKKL